MKALRYGDRGWLIECPGCTVEVAEQLRAVRWGVGSEVVVGAQTCLLRFADRPPAPERVLAAVARIGGLLSAGAPQRDAADRPQATIEVRYDGEDLPSVARAAGLTVPEVVAAHCSADYRVAFVGFSPGFGYLEGLPPQLHLARRSTPRLRVPAGSVAIADRFSAVYPNESPGGWHVIGTTRAVLFDVDRAVPSLLRTGMGVRFVAAA